jgi:hypothetical protein
MPTTSEPRVEDIQRIAFVTQRFHELQGLMPAMFGAGLILASLMAHGMSMSRFYVASPLQALNFANIFCVFSVIYLPRIYRQTFGEAVGTPRQKFLGLMPMLLVMIGFMADMFVEVGKPAPSFAAAALASCSIWIVSRDWRWRIHHLVPAAAGIIAAIITATVPPLLNRWGVPDPVRSEAYLLSLTILGLGMVTAGLFDHRLLASSLGPRSSGESGARLALARADSGGTRAAIAAVFCIAAAGALWSVSPRFISVALPLALMLSVFASQMLLALFQISKAVRRGALAAAPPVLKLHIGSDSLVLMFVMALAAAIESAIGPRGVTLLTVAIGGASAWVAVRDWPYRGHYLIGTIASAAVVFFSTRVEPAQAFAMLVFAVSGAMMLEGLLDHWIARRHLRVKGPSDGEAANAQTRGSVSSA